MSKKTIIIKLTVKPQWKVARGHQPHLNGGAMADRRIGRCKTRADQNRKAIQCHSD